MIIRGILSLAAAAALLACNGYDPELGDVPFRCGAEEPQCPSGYVCVEHSDSQRLCEREGGVNQADAGPGQPDSGGNTGEFTCNDDSALEPNNQTSQATVTPIPTFGTDYQLVGLAICPAGDQDVFRFAVDSTGMNARVDVNHNASRGQLELELLNQNGNVISTGMPVAGNPNTVRATVPNLPTGSYYAVVKAPAGVRNNYDILIVTTP